MLENRAEKSCKSKDQTNLFTTNANYKVTGNVVLKASRDGPIVCPNWLSRLERCCFVLHMRNFRLWSDDPSSRFGILCSSGVLAGCSLRILLSLIWGKRFFHFFINSNFNNLLLIKFLVNYQEYFVILILFNFWKFVQSSHLLKNRFGF